VHQSAGQQLQLVYPSRGYLSSVSTVLHFGLGADTLADSVTVRFPDGRGKVICKVASGSTVDVAYAGAVPLPMPRLPDAGGRPVFENVTAGTGAAFRHRENDFIDFKREPFLPHKFSGAGPGIATGDVNGDGLEDFYIGNARGSAGSLFLQTPGGTFRPGPSQPWTADRMQEDDDCLLFDADNDGDLDLYVVSGGSEENQTSPYYQDRLYRNDGQGRFSRCTTCLPEIRISGSCITAADFDGDGDLDLFRGGRIGPGQYPLPVANYLLRNDNGTFTDVIGTAAPDLQRPAGLVTAAVWSDFSGDGRPDLVVTGEWMPVLFFENTGGVLQHAGDRETDEHNRGWWNALAAVDVDGDGDTDYIAGNYGLNLRLTASPARPLRVYANDFDSSGTVDAVICNYEPDGRSYPIYSREDFTDQIRSYKSKLLRYADYAGKTIEELIPQPLLGNSFVLSATNMATCIVRNDGGGRFTYVPLPVEAQISPVFGIVTGDFDGDGRQDLLLGGNSFSESFDMGNCDCGNGLFLAGDGRGGFEPLPARRSGFVASRDVKAMKAIRRPGGKTFILVGNNNDGLQVFATAEQGHVEARR